MNQSATDDLAGMIEAQRRLIGDLVAALRARGAIEEARAILPALKLADVRPEQDAKDGPPAPAATAPAPDPAPDQADDPTTDKLNEISRRLQDRLRRAGGPKGARKP